MNEDNRFKSWLDAARNVGLVYMIAERLFYILSFIDHSIITYNISRKVSNLSIPKRDPFKKDIFKLMSFLFIGIILPIILRTSNSILHSKLFLIKIVGIVGIYNVVNVMQHHINVIAFDKFRADRLPPIHKSNNKILIKLEEIYTAIIPYDKRIVNSYKITFGPRRLILSLMDFWLLLVGYSLIYWSLVPEQFSICLNNYEYAIYYSIVCGVTLGYGDITPKTELAMYVTSLETLNCFLFALVIIASTITLLQKPTTLDDS
ncbi:MAG: ion channel [Desulfobaccales bacterium]